MASIATGAPATGYTSTVGYAYWLPISETPPSDATTALPVGALNIGYVGDDGPELTAELDTVMLKDWNLDDVMQLKNGASASIQLPVFGWSADQAKIIYGEDSIVTTVGGFSVVWAGEIPARFYLILELRGANGKGRIVTEAQVGSPGNVSLKTNEALSHTITCALFKNEAFVDAQGRPSYFAWHDQAVV